jgi:hypothetical protein
MFIITHGRNQTIKRAGNATNVFIVFGKRLFSFAMLALLNGRRVHLSVVFQIAAFVIEIEEQIE